MNYYESDTESEKVSDRLVNKVMNHYEAHQQASSQTEKKVSIERLCMATFLTGGSQVSKVKEAFNACGDSLMPALSISWLSSQIIASRAFYTGVSWKRI